MADDTGFDLAFLPGVTVTFPSPATATVRDDIRLTKAGDAIRHCTHFSLSMSASRRLCRWVAWNIDGSTKVATTGDQRHFAADPDYTPDDQTGAKLYVDDALDQGHIAAFADVSWGTTTVAAQARKESCYFSNITPQMDTFNRSDLKGIWGKLENEIAKENSVAGSRLSEFGGPIFAADDKVYRGVLVPSDFFKIVAWAEDGALKAKAFRLTQKDLEGTLALLALEDFRVYQQPVADIGTEVGLDFGPLVAADTASAPAAAPGAHPRLRRITKLSEVSASGW
jgi:endonuclease G